MIDVSFNDIIGLPFKDSGTGLSGDNPGGFDCYNLAREVFSRYNINLPKTNISVIECANISQKEIDKHKSKFWKKIDIPIEPCAIQIFSSNDMFANHIATYIGEGKVIHITIKSNVIIQRLSNIQKQKIEGFYKYVGNSN